jgi:hypothetical protein
MDYGKLKRSLKILAISILLLVTLLLGKEITSIPMTGQGATQTTINVQNLNKSKYQSQNRVEKVDVPDLFSYPVLLLDNKPPEDGVGQYKDATRWNNIGLIAHNHSAGNSFFKLSPGMKATVTFSSGEIEIYTVYNVMIFQASNPNSFRDPFISSEGEKIQAKDLITKAYQSGELTFQTCVAAEGSMTWGLFFVQAKPEQ